MTASARGAGAVAAARALGPIARGLGMPALLAAAIGLTRVVHPDFGPFEIQTLALGALPLALAAAAQAIVVISGGIDLSIGSLIAVANVLSASLMQHASFLGIARDLCLRPCRPRGGGACRTALSSRSRAFPMSSRR